MNETVPAPDQERAYFSVIETAFIARRGTPFLLSPRDFALMRTWHDLSIPAEDVVAGIDDAFDRRAERGSGTRINSLAYCEGAVLGAWERRSAARTGGSGKSAETPLDVGRVLDDLRASLDGLAAKESRFAEPALTAARSIERGAGREIAPAAWEEKLRRMEKHFLAAVESALTESERERLETAIAGSVAGETDRMSPEALRRTLAVLRRRWLRETLNTPFFSLLR